MCQGLTSSGGKIDKVKKNQMVLIKTENHHLPIAVGKMILNDEEIRQ